MEDRTEVVEESVPVECTLTEAEKAARFVALGEALYELDRLDAEKKDLAEAQKQPRSKLNEAKRALIKAAHEGKEERLIMCRLEWDWERGRVKATRIDTGEIAWDREIEKDERQAKMELV